MCFNPYIDDHELLNNFMEFEQLFKFAEGFDSMQTQDGQTGNSGQNANPGNNLSPDQYRSTAASEYEEDKPFSKEKNELNSVIEMCKTFKSGMSKPDVDRVIHQLNDILRKMN